MASLNKVMLIGRLGKDPELKNLQSTQVCNFSIATSDKYKDKAGNTQEKTEWHNIVAFGKQAEVCGKYLAKGNQVFVEGRLQTSSYDKNGQTVYSTKIIVSSIQFLGSKPKNNDQGNTQSNQQTDTDKYFKNRGSEPVQDTDIPF